MSKFYEQVDPIQNPKPDRRNHGRLGKKCWPKGTRWIVWNRTGRLYGDGFEANDELTKTILAHCKEVEPGFGAVISKFNFDIAISRLIDQGKITVADLQKALKQAKLEFDEEFDEEDEEFEHDFNFSRSLLDQELYRYRHWLTLDPPSEELVEAADEHDRVKAAKMAAVNGTQNPS